MDLENEIKNLKEIISKYEKIFEIEDGRVFLNSSLGVRGNILSGGHISATDCASGITSPYYDKVEELQKMNKDDWEKEVVRQQKELEERDKKRLEFETKRNKSWFKW